MKYIRFEHSSFFLLFLFLLILSFCFMNGSGEELYLLLSNFVRQPLPRTSSSVVLYMGSSAIFLPFSQVSEK